MVLNVGQKLRFAPSPNGYLHLGHAYSALLNWHFADKLEGQCLLRIEDIDLARSKNVYCSAIFEDLAWLGLSWPEPVLFQSTRFEIYQSALDDLTDRRLIYPAFLSRRDIRKMVSEFEMDGRVWPRDPDGSPVYPGTCKQLSDTQRQLRIERGDAFNWRLDMEAALQIVGRKLNWLELDADLNCTDISADPSVWGDVVLARRDVPTSYHLSVVLDDAYQDIDFVVRGQDLYAATSIHRVLQTLFDLPAPNYHHHSLIRASDERKLSKSDHATSVREMRDIDGLTPLDVKQLIGF